MANKNLVNTINKRRKADSQCMRIASLVALCASFFLILIGQRETHDETL